MAVVELRKCLIILMILYVLAFFGAMLAAISMIMHVYPQSECLLFSTSGQGGKLFYGNYASKFVSVHNSAAALQLGEMDY